MRISEHNFRIYECIMNFAFFLWGDKWIPTGFVINGLGFAKIQVSAQYIQLINDIQKQAIFMSNNIYHTQRKGA